MLVTATKTRKKQQTEAIRQALQMQEDKQKEERESFLITTIPITQQASHEPGLDHGSGEDHVEGIDFRYIPLLLLIFGHNIFRRR